MGWYGHGGSRHDNPNIDRSGFGAVFRIRKLVQAQPEPQHSVYGRSPIRSETAGAYWLLDEIALANAYDRSVKAEEFQVWTLTKIKSGHGAMLTFGDGNGQTVYTKQIEYMDIPLDIIKLFCENGTILLPSEH